MNIWLINHYAVPPNLYPLARTTNFAKYLIRKGHTVTIFAASSVHNSNVNLIIDNSKYRAKMVDGIPYVYVNVNNYEGNGKARIINMFHFAQRLPSVCKHFPKPDAILASSATPMACMSGIKLAKKYNCKCIAEISDLWPESFVAYDLIKRKNPLLKLMYAYEKQIYKKADKIIFTMEGGRDYIIEKGWDKGHSGTIDLNKVHHINNGVDLESFDYNRENYTFQDKDLDESDTFKVVYTGAVRCVNNIGALVNVAELLKNGEKNNVKIVVYGDGNEREELASKCLEKGLTNIVFKGKVDKKYIPYILSKSDLNLVHVKQTHIMRFGCSLNKIFDYFASGKPILSDLKVGYDLIEKYGAGKTISQEIETLANELICFSRLDKDDYEKYCANARCAAQAYDFKVLTEKLIDIFER